MIETVKDDEWGLYPNFSKQEMACSHTGLCFVTHKLMSVLQAVRNDIDLPMIITSGYRDVSHPVERKKKGIGEHARGMAADISIRGEEALLLVYLAMTHGVRRVGVSQAGDEHRFIHLGVGTQPDHPPSIWSY